MKRKRGFGKCKPKKPQVAAASKASAHSGSLNAEDYSDWGDIGNDSCDPRMEAETTQANTTMRCHDAGLPEQAFLGEINGGKSMPNNNILKSVASFAAKLSRAVGSSSTQPMDKTLPLQEEKTQGEEPKIPYQDPQYNELELNAALLVIKKVMKTDAAKPFNVPVDPAALGIPDYLDVIGMPMDFGTICNNLKLGLKYRDSEDVYKDVQLIWDNCSKYHKKGDYILEVMERAKGNFVKHWNAVGLSRQHQEVYNGVPECFTRHNKDGHMFPASSMVSNSVHKGRLDLVGLCQVQRQQYSPCFSHAESQHVSSCQCDWQPMEFQSMGLQPHCSRHLAARGHLHLPIHGVSSSSTCNKCEYGCTSVPMSCNLHKHSQMCSCHIHEHQSLRRCSDQCQPHQKTCQYQSNSDKMQNTKPDTRDAGNAGHAHLHSPVESTVRHTDNRLRHPMSPVPDGSSQQQRCQVGPSQAQSPLMIHNHSYQSQEMSCQCKLELGHPKRPLPHNWANSGEHSHAPPPTESSRRHATYRPEYSGTLSTDDFDDQEECQMGLTGWQSPPLVQSDQPKENGVQGGPISSPPAPSLPQDGADASNAEALGVERKTRGRGPTRCLKLLGEGKRISITSNELGQPVGLEAPKLVSFLGTLARNGHLAPLTYVDWRAVPEENKENMWEEVQTRFEIDPSSKSWVVKSLGKKWKDWKSKLKTAHYIIHTSDAERLADRDERVLPDQWAYLVSHWSSEEAEKRSATNKANRAQQKFGHITGTKSFARIREEQRVKRPDGKAPSRAELFILTRTRKDGNPVNEASSAVITQLRQFTSQQQDTSRNITAPDDVFSQVVGRDRHGRVRCYGLGPSPSDFQGAKPAQAEATKLVSEANDEVRQMKERLVAMEQTCAQMAQQMATMMSMLSSMQKCSPDDNVPDVVLNGSGTSEAAPEQQEHSTSLRRSTRRGNFGQSGKSH